MNSNFFEKARANMVNNQILPNGVKNLALIESFDNIKKELFVPDSEKEVVYSDSDIMISPDRYLLRSFVLAKMFEHCSFSKNDSVLIIGCLTGYSVAIISNLVNYVFGVENCKKLVDQANSILSSMGCLNTSVFFKTNLISGNNKNSPYDKIFIEGAVNSIPNVLVKQLKDNGEIYTVLKEDDYIGEFVRGQKIDSLISFTKLFNTNIYELKDFIIQENGYEKSL
jgi:protein-L-isoaspartate(D-aspartate) O-methyltransferase